MRDKGGLLIIDEVRQSVASIPPRLDQLVVDMHFLDTAHLLRHKLGSVALESTFGATNSTISHQTSVRHSFRVCSFLPLVTFSMSNGSDYPLAGIITSETIASSLNELPPGTFELISPIAAAAGSAVLKVS